MKVILEMQGVQQVDSLRFYSKIVQLYHGGHFIENWGQFPLVIGGCRGRGHMIVGFRITCAISAYHYFF